MTVRLLIADDDPLVRQLLCKICRPEGSVQVVGEGVDGVHTLTLLEQLRPDVILLDNLMPGLHGIEVLQRIADGRVRVSVVVLAAHMDKQQTLEALQLGARGVLEKKFLHKLLECVVSVAEGGYWIQEQRFPTLRDAILFMISQPRPTSYADAWNLTTRELQVISLVAAGQSNCEVAATLSISEQTVKRHLANIFKKCGVANRVELGLFALRHKLLASSSTVAA